MKYSHMIMEHFDRPRRSGELPHAQAVGEATNPACMDWLKLFLVIDSHGVVRDASFLARGCVPTLAAGSYLADYVCGKCADDLRRLEWEVLEELLGGLPATKKHAAILGVDALHAALENY